MSTSREQPLLLIKDKQNGDVSDEVSLLKLFRPIWRWRWVVFITFACVLTSGIFLIKSLQPIYTASIQIVLGIKNSDGGAMDSMSGGVISRDTAQVRSQMDILHSSSLIRRVIHTLRLTDDPEFNPTLQPREPSLIDRAAARLPLPAYVSEWIMSNNLEEPVNHNVTSAIVEEEVSQLLSITNDGRSYTIVVSFQSVDPTKAATIANAFGDIYLTQQLEQRSKQLERASDLLDHKSGELRSRVLTAEMAVQEYKIAHNIVEISKSATLADDMLVKLNTELAVAKRQVAEAEASLAQIRNFALSSDRETAAQHINNIPTLQDLFQEESNVRLQIAENEAIYMDKHPTMLNLRAKLAEAHASVVREVDRVLAGLEAKVHVTRAAEAEITRKLSDATHVSQNDARASVELRQLQNDADTAHTLYATFLQSAGRAAAEADVLGADATIVSPAAPPLRPSFPQTRILVGVTGVLALTASLVLALILEGFGRSIYTPEDVTRRTGVPVVGMVPHISRAGRTRAQLSLIPIQNPLGELAEALRSLGISLALGGSSRIPRVVLITSALPNEGKTSLAVAFARLNAASGKSVLLIECDLRRPSFRTVLDTGNGPGLTDLLSDQNILPDVLQVDEASGMEYITCGSPTQFPAELLASTMMDRLIKHCRRHYDTIILDTPPVGVVSDALVLSHLADSTMVVVRWGKTPREAFETALSKVLSSANYIPGIVLTQVPKRHLAGYGTSYKPLQEAIP